MPIWLTKLQAFIIALESESTLDLINLKSIFYNK